MNDCLREIIFVEDVWVNFEQFEYAKQSYWEFSIEMIQYVAVISIPHLPSHPQNRRIMSESHSANHHLTWMESFERPDG